MIKRRDGGEGEERGLRKGAETKGKEEDKIERKETKGKEEDKETSTFTSAYFLIVLRFF